MPCLRGSAMYKEEKDLARSRIVLVSCVTLGKSLYLSGPWILQLKENNISALSSSQVGPNGNKK